MRISDWSSDVCSSDLHKDQIWSGGKTKRPVCRQEQRRWKRSMPRPACLHELPSRRPSPELPMLRPTDDPRGKQQVRRRSTKRKKIQTQSQASGGSVPFRRTTLSLAYPLRSEEHTSELQSLMRIQYDVFCL